MSSSGPFRGLWPLLVATLPTAALAASVYLNGVNIDGVANQRFDKANVRIDDKGNVFIDAPGYSVQVVDPGAQGSTRAQPSPGGTTVVATAVGSAPPVEKPQLTRRYFLVTEQTVTGMTDYDIDVYINAKWVRKLSNGEDQVVTEVTRYLNPGRNTVLLAAHKLVNGPRKSYSPSHVFRVVVGTGNVGGDNVMIDEPVVRFARTAAEDKDISQDFSFTTR